MKHLAIFKLNSTVVTIRGDTAYDKDGNVVSYDESAVTTESNMMELRQERDAKLAATDWWASSDLTMTSAQTAYRQALRDITDSATSLDDVTWPEKP
tara:strand:- start:426 stop:716 length:291 start_codon:yes stop_codon:yes gene_type:complete